MAGVPPIYLVDSGGQVWLVGVTNSAILTSTPVTGPIGVPGMFLSDTIGGAIWTLGILPSGNLTTTLGGPPTAPAQIPVQAPNGTLYAIQIASGSLQTAIAVAQCPFTLGDVDGALAARLYDQTGQFWTPAERVLYIKEALRTWNSLTGYWRGDFLFDSAPGTQWYDLTDQLAMPNTLRPETIVLSDLMTQIEYHLLEPAVGVGTWTGSLQYASSDLEQAIQRRRNETLGSANCKISVIELPAVSIRTDLPTNVTDVRRIAFIPADTTIPPNILWKDDSWALDAYSVGYTMKPAGIPRSYRMSTEPWMTFDTDILPVPGKFQLLVVSVGSINETTANPDPALSVPDDWTWVVKFGALGDLFGRESNAKDGLRQEYCNMRYKDGLKLLSQAPALMGIRLNNVPLKIGSVVDYDQYKTSWQGRTAATPDRVLAAGLNVFALTPVADAGPYSLTVTVIQNAPMPADSNTCLLLDRSLFDIIVDYAQHLAMLKCGGAEFAQTMPHYQRFMRAAAIYASKFQELGQYPRTLMELSQKEALSNPVMKPALGDING